MRRIDREVTDRAEILRIIERCDVCRLGLTDGQNPYIVPMNFGYEEPDGTLILYFHCATEGRKLDLIRQHANVCFEMDCDHKLMIGNVACSFTMEYACVMGVGTISICEGRADKQKALTLLMRHYAVDRDFSFPPQVLDPVLVLKLEVSRMTAKRLLRETTP